MIGPCPVSLYSIAPFWHFPNLLHFRHSHRLRQVEFKRRTCCLDVPDIHQPCFCRNPLPCKRTTPCIAAYMPSGTLIKPSRRSYPCILTCKISFLRSRFGGLIPGMVAVNRISQWICRNKHFFFVPIIIIRTSQKDPD